MEQCSLNLTPDDHKIMKQNDARCAVVTNLMVFASIRGFKCFQQVATGFCRQVNLLEVNFFVRKTFH